MLLGSDAFVEKLNLALTEKATLTEVPRMQRLAHRPALKKLLSAQQASVKATRDRKVREARLK